MYISILRFYIKYSITNNLYENVSIMSQVAWAAHTENKQNSLKTKYTRGTLPVDVYRLGQFTFQGQHLVNPIIALIHSTHTVTLFIDIYDNRVGERRVFIVVLSWIMSRGQWQGAMRAPPALEKPERQPRTDALSAFPR